MDRNVASDQVEAALTVVTSMARSYTGDTGISNGVPSEQIGAVVLAATCRLLANPGQLRGTESMGTSAAPTIPRSPASLDRGPWAESLLQDGRMMFLTQTELPGPTGRYSISPYGVRGLPRRRGTDRWKTHHLSREFCRARNVGPPV